MFNITYDTWKSVCCMYFSQKSGVHKAYLQWYPFAKLDDKDIELISSIRFFEKYVQSGSFVIFPRNMFFSDNYLQKGDGSFRNSSLVSPLLYLVLQSIGKTISINYIQRRPVGISVYYSGNFDAMQCSYKNEYDAFYKQINAESTSYDHFIKTDIHDFFSSINLNTMFERIDAVVNADSSTITQRHLQLYKEMISFCGNGKYPIIENSTSTSYLATIVYLDEIDARLHGYLSNKVKGLQYFSMVRYVDDLYILLSSSRSEVELNGIYNEVMNEYSSILKEYDLSLNTKKCCIKPISEINNELKKSLYDEYVNGKKHEISELCPNAMLNFINKLNEELSFDYITTEKYNQILDESFSVSNVEFNPSEIFNYFVYENSDCLLDPEVSKAIGQLVNTDVSFISLDPKRLTIMVMRSGCDSAIKKFLNHLFFRSNNGIWNSYDTSIAINYLIQSKFNHIDLLSILRLNCPKLYDYFSYFCKCKFVRTFSDGRNDMMANLISQDEKTCYLYFMYLCEKRSGNTMGAFAYFKNFFDRLSGLMAFLSNYENNGRSPNYPKFYKEGALKRLYEQIDGSQEIIEEAHRIRNENPLSHASAGLIDSDSSTARLTESISKLYELACEYCENVIPHSTLSQPAAH